jgi:hypothetical protein
MAERKQNHAQQKSIRADAPEESMIQQQCTELAALATELNTASSSLNNTIAEINRQPAALNIGLEVWVGTYNSNAYEVGYAKIDSGWGLATRNVFEPSDDDDAGESNAQNIGYSEAASLMLAPRSIRIDALNNLDQIINSLKTEAKSSINTIRNAKKIAAALTVAA